ncbi:hypothetical protein [Dyadobacter fermentans]|uniref:hypothetical protein n=1 Tax=Dyadobacter fermentans TaxID=94254 RepID=UPI001CBF3165|nr:hypothetical protein [Dyadobacter fermentans]MBZ1362009.1 hypothetical protein [Dyadobacter fermentans]
MAFTADDFVLDYFGVKLDIKTLDMQDRTVFQIIFEDGREDLFITRATLRDGKRYWMSVPEDPKRQKEAVEIGRSIVQYFKNIGNV